MIEYKFEMSTKETDKVGRKTTFDVYVGHLSKNIEEDKLIEEFQRYGEVVDILCRYGKGSYGYAIVKYKQQKDADRLLKEVDKVTINGYDMEVKNAKRNNQSVENENGSVHSKSVSFLEPPSYQIRGRNLNYVTHSVPITKTYIPHHHLGDKDVQQYSLMIEVMCTSVENAVTFYGCPVFKYEDLHNLSLKLNSICPNLMRLLKKPMENKIYGALFLEDSSWYRCTVIQSTIPAQPGMCIVQYIDYGNLDQVSYTNMVELPEPIKRICNFATKCIFSNLLCNSRPHCDISYLHHLVNQRMSLCAISSWAVPHYSVLKCSCNGIDVVSELVRNGFAIYKTHKFSNSKSLAVNAKPERNYSRFQENQTPKKLNNIATKKTNGTCDYVKKHSSNEVDNSKRLNKIAETGLFNDVQCDGRDFAPKKIIKRGSDISDMVLFPVLEAAKVKQTVNHFLKVDCVISNLKLVNSVRNLVSLINDDNLINSAVVLLTNKDEVKGSGDFVDGVKEAYREYNNVLNEIKNCINQELLHDFKKRRELQKSELCTELKKFLENFDMSVLEKRRKIQIMIMDLESNSNAWTNVYLSSQPSSIEQLFMEYNKEKEEKWNIIQKARENTNEKHRRFMEFLADFQKEFSLNMMEENVEFNHDLKLPEGKKGSWALKFEESLSDLGTALEEEMKTCNVSKGENCVSVIQCILDKLDIPKEKIDAECEIYEKFKSLFDDLQNMTDLSCVFETLAAVQEEIKTLSIPCIDQKDPEKVEIPDRYSKLHEALTKEDYLLETLAKASALHFPELVVEHPELNLSEYQKNWYLMKHSWKIDYFPHVQTCSRVETSYMSKFIDQPVVIKEFEFTNELEKISFMKKAIIWNEIKNKSLVKIKALFNKDEKTVCTMLTFTSSTLLENLIPGPVERKNACYMLQQILLGLKDIHSRGMVHGAIHPSAILYNEGEVVLDFNYDLKFLHDKMQIKGINFRAPCGEDMCKSADMYGFGCLILWILFPNLSFTSTKEGVPNLYAFQSIIENLLSEKDFSALATLLNTNPDLRPSSRKLLSIGFLKDFRIVSETMS